jgi:hypothetical protein
MEVLPPVAYAQVSQGIYRCSHPSPSAYPFLLHLKFRTLVCVDGCEVKTELKEFCAENEIALVEKNVGHNQEPFVLMSTDIVQEVVDLCLGGKMLHAPLLPQHSCRSEISTLLALLFQWKGNRCYCSFLSSSLFRYVSRSSPPLSLLVFANLFIGAPSQPSMNSRSLQGLSGISMMSPSSRTFVCLLRDPPIHLPSFDSPLSLCRSIARAVLK